MPMAMPNTAIMRYDHKDKHVPLVTRFRKIENGAIISQNGACKLL